MTNGRLVRGLAAAALAAVALATSGCVSYQAAVKPPQGLIFSSFSAPITTNFDSTPAGDKLLVHSEEKTLFINTIWFGNYAFGDPALEKIAREGGIGDVSYADYELFSILGVVVTMKVNVYGTPAKEGTT